MVRLVRLATYSIRSSRTVIYPNLQARAQRLLSSKRALSAMQAQTCCIQGTGCCSWLRLSMAATAIAALCFSNTHGHSSTSGQPPSPPSDFHLRSLTETPPIFVPEYMDNTWLITPDTPEEDFVPTYEGSGEDTANDYETTAPANDYETTESAPESSSPSPPCDCGDDATATTGTSPEFPPATAPDRPSPPPDTPTVPASFDPDFSEGTLPLCCRGF
jgi:hypothetical protein